MRVVSQYHCRNLSAPSCVLVFRSAHRRAKLVTWRRTNVSVVVAITVLTLSSCGGHSSASSSTTAATSPTTTTVPPIPKPSLAVDLAATPKGWVPVDYGNAQISVPSSWVITLDGCLFRDSVAFGSQPTQPDACSSAPNEPIANPDEVRISALPSYVKLQGEKLAVNGLPLYRGLNDGGPGLAVWLVPSLGVRLELVGPISTEVLHTLTHSPREVTLATSKPPAVPSSWHRVDFAGLSIAVPIDWPEQQVSSWGTGCAPTNLSLLAPPAVVLNRGTSEPLVSCPAITELEMASATPTDGLVIDPGPYGPLQGQPGFGTCLHINDLTACPTTTDLYGILVLALHIPGRTQPVAVEIGLAGNGVVARIILFSMRTG